MLKLLHVVGARPNFMKAAPVMSANACSVGPEDRTGAEKGERKSSCADCPVGPADRTGVKSDPAFI